MLLKCTDFLLKLKNNISHLFNFKSTRLMKPYGCQVKVTENNLVKLIGTWKFLKAKLSNINFLIQYFDH